MALTQEEVAISQEEQNANVRLAVETRIALEAPPPTHGVRHLGKPSFYTCPECHGSMVVIAEGAVRRYRCHTGHGFSQGALSQQGLVRIEATLWSALAQLEEQKMLQVDLAEQARHDEKPALEARHRGRIAEIDAFAERTRTLALDPLLGDLQA